MNTPRRTITLSATDPDAIARAAEVIRAGGLVAFPTETVYGLGADALNAAAVRDIFVAKGRPAINPIIVHAADVSHARDVTREWPALAARLAARFWPGPLTLVLRRAATIPDEVTAGLDTVGVRVPAHPIALTLLSAANRPIAAPSANRSSHLSPTTAKHVLRDLDGRIDLLIDGGATPGGIESTVLDLTSDSPRLLRPGLLEVAEIEAATGVAVARPDPSPAADRAEHGSAPLPAPGMLARHYAPRAPVEIAADDGERRVLELASGGRRVGWVTFGHATDSSGAAAHPPPEIVPLDLPREARACAAVLYASLHALDDAGVAVIVVSAPPATDDWLAIRDRLARGAQNARSR
ncbi:MAG: L-threonylcarbamoyladenylate synthase [Phycisphaerae bacterium]